MWWHKSFLKQLGLLDDNARIFPYYEKKLPEAETFLRGKSLARNFTQLCRICELKGRSLDSSLYFTRTPLRKNELNWLEPLFGLCVFEEMLEIARLYSSSFVAPDELISDLEFILLALKQALNHRSRFLLIHRYSNSTNALEWEEGGGYL